MNLLLGFSLLLISQSFEFIGDAGFLSGEPITHFRSTLPDFLNYCELGDLHAALLDGLMSLVSFLIRNIDAVSEVNRVNDLFEAALQLLIKFEHHCEGRSSQL